MLKRDRRVLLLLTIAWSSGGAVKDLRPDVSDQELFWGADQYDFAIVLPATGLDCFWHFAHQGERFYLNFMVQWVTGLANDKHLSVIVNAPSGLIMSSVDDAKGEIAFIAGETGFYQMCFSNFHNHFGSMQIFLNFGVYYEGLKDFKKEEEIKKEEEREHLNKTISTMEESSNRLQTFMFHMWRYYNIERMRRGTDYFLLQSNSSYVSTWSAVQGFVIIMAGYLQLFFLKRLFDIKPTTETEKPRC
ncbi:transmembrane emp24 domain-containing protein 6-like [Electrophorus electricus]|uniref:transmembrane emp24 domain-containing protein 6-like n=1 Tax=Electrophorus electricus TaxID=8005 RepID=UPI0015D0AFD6|nr:transmembrane emp24 domain-containing protein 6-like [Electrophorus electricus]